ncbi:DUF3597 domain-containing protein [Paenalcaligenes niemegkensis]|uniref:DUF3597 domain-containing protein n=1 Tax=Paenalcaligenes niemegkensis TaxID=2895469 RepID=UPI001EE89DEA|nr:DUF3597 domain-containing protein [Paenalcaligenes niemegkensis]MCQ9617089.1 DUF3597 domain-containing protein [Paenalcaligenes niemegkensis]
MSIFKNILAKIFPSDKPEENPASTSAATSSDSINPAASDVPPSTGSVNPSAQQEVARAAAQRVDVTMVLSEMQSKHPEQLNWQTSIVDLLKLLGLDSSLAARKQLAAELGYAGSTEDSATMNIWLHKEVMRKLAENNGQLPADLGHNV